jgi:DNA-directed RNA polymerase specialized sigma24 family protein
MAADGSVSIMIQALKQGDRDAAQVLWNRYFQRLVGLAQTRLRGVKRPLADEEDVALSALDSFYRGAARGRFPQLADRDELWQLLVVITVRKVYDLVRHEGRPSRGGGRLQTLSDLVDAGAGELLGNEPTPELAAQVAEECTRLLDRLGNDTLRSVALWKMEGHTNEEIAAKLGCVRFTVDRKLQNIRQIWNDEKPEG